VTDQYRRGAVFERQIADRLTEDGYLVMRAAGSHGHADLIALKRGQVLLVQCKLAGAGAVPPAEWNGLWEVAERVGAVALIVSRPKRGAKAWQRITGPKSGVRGVKPPCVVWTSDEVIGHG
jgi:Holliday junction resolvase